MRNIISKKHVELLKSNSVQKELGLPKLRSNLSPFRYPGGKGKLSKFLATFLLENDLHGTVLVEPFCGGAGGTLPLLEAGLISKLVLNDYNKSIAKFWEIIITDPCNLIAMIEKEAINIERWHHWKRIYNDDQHPLDIDKAFSVFFLNRTNRSGILHAGPIGGKNQTGNYKIDCRFTKANLIKRIETIAKLGDKIEVKCEDAASLIKKCSKNEFIYADPPYVKEGKGIYEKFYFTKAQHENLSEAIKLCSKHWLLSYDDDELIHSLYSGSDINVVELSYVMNTAKLGRELLIASSWLDMPSINFDLVNKKISNSKKLISEIDLISKPTENISKKAM